MSGVVSLASLLIQETQANILATALTIAADIGLPVTAWNVGDPTRSTYLVESAKLSALEELVTGFISSGFLDYATGTWLVILALEVFNVVVPPATFATGNVTLTNAGGGFYVLEPGDVTAQCSATGQTYHSTTGGTLSGVGTPGATLSLAFEADAAGSASNAAATQIDTLITTMTGVTCSNPGAFVGIDQQSDATTRQQCRDKLGSLSPMGPSDAYSYVARNSALTGTTNVTRVRVYPNSLVGTVLVYLAGGSSGSSAPDVALVNAAILEWAAPLCITPIVNAATNVVIPVTYTVWVYNSVNLTSSGVQAGILAALEALFSAQYIGGDIIPPATTGFFYLSDIEAAIKSAFPQIINVTIAAPAGDTSLTNGSVPVLGTVTPTVNFVINPTGI